MNRTHRLILAAAAALCLTGAATALAEEHGGHEREHGVLRGGPHVDGRGYVFDGRYDHGHYYPAYGAHLRVLPEGYRPYFWHGSPFYFWGGIWYAPGPVGFVVVRPPAGLAIGVLPPYYTTVWIGGIPYYYADNAYYTWSPEANGYVVVEPPAGADAPGTPPPRTSQDLIIYPKNGQSKEQEAADDFECHRWATGQSGFDPTQPGGGGGSREAYNRAKSACLTARGYEVK